jgi:hypothetical protein
MYTQWSMDVYKLVHAVLQHGMNQLSNYIFYVFYQKLTANSQFSC